LTSDEHDWLAKRFDERRPRLRAVAYRMLGSLSDADDAVQETWLRLSRTDSNTLRNFDGWLTTVVARVSLNILRARTARGEDFAGVPLPEPIVGPANGPDPEQEALLADSVGLALLVVLETLSPAERLAYVLHDMFTVSFDEIAEIMERSPDAVRQLASRARRRVQGEVAFPDVDLDRQWEVVDAFLKAAREGEFEALIGILDPGVVLKAHAGTITSTPLEVRGPDAVAEQTMVWARSETGSRRALVNGTPGLVAIRDGRAGSVAAITVRGGRVVEIAILTDPERLRQLDLTILGPE
jgi:RNA polymerase sigma-70 factor, ECF subfamily